MDSITQALQTLGVRPNATLKDIKQVGGSPTHGCDTRVVSVMQELSLNHSRPRLGDLHHSGLRMPEQVIGKEG